MSSVTSAAPRQTLATLQRRQGRDTDGSTVMEPFTAFATVYCLPPRRGFMFQPMDPKMRTCVCVCLSVCVCVCVCTYTYPAHTPIPPAHGLGGSKRAPPRRHAHKQTQTNTIAHARSPPHSKGGQYREEARVPEEAQQPERIRRTGRGGEVLQLCHHRLGESNREALWRKKQTPRDRDRQTDRHTDRQTAHARTHAHAHTAHTNTRHARTHTGQASKRHEGKKDNAASARTVATCPAPPHSCQPHPRPH